MSRKAPPSATCTARADARDVAAHAAPVFRLHGGPRDLIAEGCHRRMPPGPAATLGARVSAFFASAEAGAHPLVGLLPFDPYQDDALYQPERLVAAAMQSTQSRSRPELCPASRPDPAIEAWRGLVSSCRSQLEPRQGDPARLQKVVLARSLCLTTSAAVDLRALIQRLACDPNVTAYLAPLPVLAGSAPAWLVGATPELLISRRGSNVLSQPLAGSAPRSSDPATDRAHADALITSHKDQDEHRYVVEAILDTLAPLCRQLNAPARPSLLATRTMWHLATRIEGRLKHSETSVAELAGVLHPTPAVCGTPRQAALNTIRELEPAGRGFYAGAVGWVDAAGDGDWHVSIRCARVQGRNLRLYAGAGILADSAPALEVAETHAKFKAMLDALGIAHADDDAEQYAAGDTGNGCD